MSLWEYVEENMTSVLCLVEGVACVILLRLFGVDPMSAGITAIFLMVLTVAYSLDREKRLGTFRRYHHEPHVPAQEDHVDETIEEERFDGRRDA